jgi:crossover junction endodeoxyribonuclease RusA
MRVDLELPWPPTANTYYRRRNVAGMKATGKGMRISDRGLRYRRLVLGILLEQRAKPFSDLDRLAVKVEAYPPDRRCRDIDNLLKSMLDALQHAGLIPDDSQIDDLAIVRRGRRPPSGGLTVTITSLGDAP